MMKKILTIFMCLVMAICLVPENTFASNSDVITGLCGGQDTITYNYDKNTGQLSFLTESNYAIIRAQDFEKISVRLGEDNIVKSIFLGKGISNVDIRLNSAMRLLQDVESFSVSEDNAKYKSLDGVLVSDYDTDQETLVFYPGKKNLTEYTIPAEVKKVSGYAFLWCGSLKNILVPDTVNYFEPLSIFDCGEAALNVYFLGKGKLPIVDSGAHPERVVNYVFPCISFNEEAFNILKNAVYYGDIFLQHNFEDETCIDCGATLTSIEPSIQGYNRTDCYKYPLDKERQQFLVFSKEKQSVEGAVYLEEKIEGFSVPDEIDGVKVTRLFFQGVSDENIALGHDKVKWIEIGHNIESVDIYLCGTSVESLTVPGTVSDIYVDATNHGEYCSKLKSISLPLSADLTGVRAGDTLTQVVLTKGTGRGYDYDTTMHQDTLWYRNRNKVNDIVLKEGISYIGNYSFAGLTRITDYAIPNSVKQIGNNAFYRNDSLTEVVLGDGIEEVGYQSFAENKNLVSVNIPESLTDIKYNSFDGCPKLILTVSKGSYGEKYAIENKIKYRIGKDGSVIVPSAGSGSGAGGSSAGGGSYGGGTILPSVTVETPTYSLDKGVYATASKDGKSVTFVCSEGYAIVDVMVNGVPKGPLTTLSDLKTGDKVEVTTQKVNAEKSKQEIIDMLKLQKLVARSKNVKMKNGKKAIMITWYDENDKTVNFDGIQIYRYVKKKSGYANKKTFVSQKNRFYNTTVKAGTKYYYKVRGFIVIDGKKSYTDWSSKAIRTAK